MRRRGFLTLGAGGLIVLAGCGETNTGEPTQEDSDDTTEPASEPEPEPEPEPVQTEPTPEDIDPDERAFLRNAFRLELIRTGLVVDEIEEDGSVEVYYFTSASTEADLLRETLTISDAFLGELLNQGYFPDFLQVWVIDPETQNELQWYNIQPEWVIEWAMNELTTAQYLAKIDETIEER